MRRWLCLVLCLCMPFLAAGCTALAPKDGGGAASLPMRVLAMPAYQAQEDAAQSASTGHLRVDLWLDASQLMGGINQSAESIYPHMSRKYREGGFHYRYGGQAGWYENVLRDMLIAAGDSRVRVLRCGNERLTDQYLAGMGLAANGADALRSVRRDLLTYAIDPMPTLFAELSGENMAGSFYALGTEKLNQMSRFAADDGAELENPGQVSRMSQALDAQIAALRTGNASDMSAVGSETDAPLIYALQNIDLTRLSVITFDPAGLRRLSGIALDGAPIAYVEQLLRERGVFERGLSVGLYAFTLDYMGQMSSFGAADFSEPLLWGRLRYNSRTYLSDGVQPMPRTLLALVVGKPVQLRGFTDALNRQLSADDALKGLRGPENGGLVYAANGQTVEQQPFAFECQFTVVERPSVQGYAQDTVGAALAVTEGEGTVAVENGLNTAEVAADGADRALTLSFPVQELPNGVAVDWSKLVNARVEVQSALLLAQIVPNTAGARERLGAEAQVIALRDQLYVFALRNAPFAETPEDSPFTLRSIAVSDDGKALSAVIAADGRRMQAGYYRLLVSADLTGEQLTWPSVEWENRLNTTITKEQIAAWEAFTAMMTQYDRDAALVPKQFQHAWGAAGSRAYHGMPIPDFPPVYLAPGLSELAEQLRAAANVREVPCVRYVFDVFVQ
ncbi:MAG: hypothetical protein RSC91_00385 [Clostridia bacterium]